MMSTFYIWNQSFVNLNTHFSCRRFRQSGTSPWPCCTSLHFSLLSIVALCRLLPRNVIIFWLVNEGNHCVLPAPCPIRSSWKRNMTSSISLTKKWTITAGGPWNSFQSQMVKVILHNFRGTPKLSHPCNWTIWATILKQFRLTKSENYKMHKILHLLFYSDVYFLRHSFIVIFFLSFLPCLCSLFICVSLWQRCS